MNTNINDTISELAELYSKNNALIKKYENDIFPFDELSTLYNNSLKIKARIDIIDVSYHKDISPELTPFTIFILDNIGTPKQFTMQTVPRFAVTDRYEKTRETFEVPFNEIR